MKTIYFFHEFRGEKIREGIRAVGRFNVEVSVEDGRVHRIWLISKVRSVPNYVEVDLDLPYRENNIFVVAERYLAERILEEATNE